MQPALQIGFSARRHWLAAAALGLLPGLAAAQVSVTTWHNHNLRDGQNTHEAILTPANVNSTSFGKLFSYALDAALYAQPLYLPNVSIPGEGTHNVVYVATEKNSVYAFDADGLVTTPLWRVSLSLSGESPGHCTKLADICIASGLPLGVTSTPVIDPTSNTIYVLSMTRQTNGTYIDRLHALDVTTGAEKFGGPVVIQATVAGTGAGSVGGMITFDAVHQLQRPGLLLLNGTVYLAWGALAQQQPWHGWVMAYNATTLAQTAVLNDSPNGTQGGIWESGGGLAADPAGNIYLQTGDGTFDANAGGLEYGDSFLKLSGALAVEDYFTPYNQGIFFNDDLDVGGGAGIILPTQTGPYPHEIVGADKQGNIYLVDRDAMGGYGANQNTNIQTVTGSVDGYINSPAYWNGAVYLSGNNDHLSRYTLKNGLLSTAPVSKSANILVQGSTPSISSNGTTNGIVWAIDLGSSLKQPCVLRAYNALNLAQQLYNSNQAGMRDRPGDGIAFTTPTIVNGKVYIGTATQLDVYGLL
ncbi:MAG TPA: pyrrolo-quinoline quinone [Terriglobia bacterium]|nr:pyrrolo-quinoline quinone [Terriglobia bacterium]